MVENWWWKNVVERRNGGWWMGEWVGWWMSCGVSDHIRLQTLVDWMWVIDVLFRDLLWSALYTVLHTKINWENNIIIIIITYFALK